MTSTPGPAARLAAFAAAYPQITIRPPDADTVMWTAHRGGMCIAAQPDEAALLAALETSPHTRTAAAVTSPAPRPEPEAGS